MRRLSHAAVLLAVIPVLGEAQTGFVRNSILRPYEATSVSPVNFQNSDRIFNLMRAGQLYLSLSDAIALALENNLDIETQRYLPRIAQTDIQRTKGGGSLRGLSLLVNEPAPGIGGPNGPLLTALTASSTPAPLVNTNFSDVALITQQQNDLVGGGRHPAVIRSNDSTIRSRPIGTGQRGASEHSGIRSAAHGALQTGCAVE